MKSAAQPALSDPSQSFQRALGFCQTGELDRAESLLGQILRGHPQDLKALFMLGGVYLSQGRSERALAVYGDCLKLSPGLAQAHFNQAQALKQLGRNQEALAACQRALDLNPGYVDALVLVGLLLEALGRVEQALTHYRAVLAARPGLAPALNNLGAMLTRLGRGQEAIPYYEQALAAAPESITILENLSVLLERTQRVEDALALARRGLALAPQNLNLVLTAARCLRRLKERDQAVELLKPFSGQAGADYELGKLYEQLGQSQASFTHCERANRTMTDKLPGWQEARDRYLGLLESFVRVYTQPRPTLAESGPDPVFLVGFPRSGTTLLEQALDAHSRLASLDEKPLLANLLLGQGVNDGASYAAWRGRLGPEGLAAFQQRYLAAARQEAKAGPNQAVLDKLPLNLIYAGPIQELFPRARFILALRHPADVCLSCFMHQFSFNPAMANFYRLEDAARMYDRVMGLWRLYSSALPMRFFTIRYEDVVEDLPGRLAGLLEFLELPWEDAVAKPHERARSRGVISTPSYYQVAEPVYKKASLRWLRFREQLAPILPKLEPWIRYFGYGSAGGGAA